MIAMKKIEHVFFLLPPYHAKLENCANSYWVYPASIHTNMLGGWVIGISSK